MTCENTVSLPLKSWSIITGQDFREIFIVKEDGVPKDLTGWTVKMDIRADAARSATLIHHLETGNGITVDGPEGSIELFIDDTVTADAPIKDYVKKKGYFDLFLIPPTGDNIRLLYGEIPIVDGITEV